MRNIKRKGFSLIEMLLVMVVMSALLVMLINYTTQKSDQLRRENIARELQTILNSALAFYVTNGIWPGMTVGAVKTSCTNGWLNFDNTADLQIQNYLPPQASMPTVAGNSYQFHCDQTTGLFSARVVVPLAADQTIIAGMVPLGSAQPGNVVQAQVNIPGQNLNNARSLNFAGVYYAGSCVPAPTCPIGMKPNIVVTPSAVAGVSYPPNCTGSSTSPPYDPSNCSANVYPVSSFIGFARGDNGNPSAPTDPNGGAGAYANSNGNLGPPLDCETSAVPQTLKCASSNNNVADVTSSPTDTLSSNGTLYWRVCLYVNTENGIAYPNYNAPGNPATTPPLPVGAATAAAWGKMIGTVLVFTRCVPNNEPIGSNDVWQANNGYNP